MGGVGRMACYGFLVREARNDILVGWSWIPSLWSVMKSPVVSFEVSVGLV